MIEIKFTLCRIAKLLRGGAFTLVAPIALKKKFQLGNAPPALAFHLGLNTIGPVLKASTLLAGRPEACVRVKVKTLQVFLLILRVNFYSA